MSVASSNITKAPFTYEPTNNLLSDDPARLLYELLDRLIAVGDTARQISLSLGRNGHRPEAIQKLIEEIANG